MTAPWFLGLLFAVSHSFGSTAMPQGLEDGIWTSLVDSMEKQKGSGHEILEEHDKRQHEASHGTSIVGAKHDAVHHLDNHEIHNLHMGDTELVRDELPPGVESSSLISKNPSEFLESDEQAHANPSAVQEMPSLLRREQDQQAEANANSFAQTELNVVPGVVVRHDHSAALKESQAGSVMSLQAAETSLARSAATIAAAENTMAEAMKTEAEASNRAAPVQRQPEVVTYEYSPRTHPHAAWQSGGLPQQSETFNSAEQMQHQLQLQQHLQQLIQQQEEQQKQQQQQQEVQQIKDQQQQEQQQQQLEQMYIQQHQQFQPAVGSRANPVNVNPAQSQFLDNLLVKAGFKPRHKGRADEENPGGLSETTGHSKRGGPMVVGNGGGDPFAEYTGPMQRYEDMGSAANVIGETVFPNGTMQWTQEGPLESIDCTWLWLQDKAGNSKYQCVKQFPYKKWIWDSPGSYTWSGLHRRRDTWQWLEGPEFTANTVEDMLPAGNPAIESATGGGHAKNAKKYEDMREQAEAELLPLLTTIGKPKKESDEDQGWESYNKVFD